MYELFFEKFTWILMYGLLGIVPLGILAFHFRKRTLWIATFSLLAITIGLLVMERMVVTPREELRATVFRLANIVENNDVEKLLSHISKKNDEVRDRASRELPRYDFTACNVIQVNRIAWDRQRPDEGVLDFTVSANLTYQGIKQPVWRDVTLDFRREADGKWRIVEYSHRAPFQERSIF